MTFCRASARGSSADSEGDIGERTNQRAGRRDVPTIDRHKGSKRPQRAAGLVLMLAHRASSSRRSDETDAKSPSLTESTAEVASPMAVLAWPFGLGLVVEREAADASHGEKHHHKHAHHNAHGAPAMAATLLDAADGLHGLRVVPVAGIKANRRRQRRQAGRRDVRLVIPAAAVRRLRGQGLEAARGLAAGIPPSGVLSAWPSTLLVR